MSAFVSRVEGNPYPESLFEVTDLLTGKVEHIRGLGEADRRFCEMSNKHSDRIFRLERNAADLAAERVRRAS